jgi:hypothetical protein
MNLEQIVKETVAKIVDEKKLTSAEKKKKEDIVMAMKKDFKGPKDAMYAIATDKAKKLAEGVTKDQIEKKYFEMFGKNPNTKFADVAKALGIPEQDVMNVIFGDPFGGIPFRENGLNEEGEITPFKQGEAANKAHKHYTLNPYPKGSKEHDDFYNGWMNAETASQMAHDEFMFRKERGMDESQQELDEYVIRRWQHYAGIK